MGTAAPAPSRRARLLRWEPVAVVAVVAALYLPGLGSHSLFDPWETHYGEVARRMLQDDDYIHPRWQNESFRSKPILTFWLMAGSMTALGVAEDGGWSGELVASSRPEWALRLPFAITGIVAIFFLWWAVARLASRRAAWLSALACATMPYTFFISRQAITDMPMVFCLTGALALFALALYREDRPLLPLGRGITAFHVFLGVLAVTTLSQIVAFLVALDGRKLLFTKTFHLSSSFVQAAFLLGLCAFAAWAWATTRTRRQVYLYYAYLLMGFSVLAKGPVALVVAALAILGTFVVSGQWRRLADMEIPRGLLLLVVVALPWHFAVFAADGPGWFREYVQTHLLGRTFQGVHGDRGSFLYYVSQIGVGLWPWIAVVPGALAAAILRRRPATGREHLRLLFACWALLGFLFFSAIRTKFHHYLLPTVPAFAGLCGLWLDDVLAHRARGTAALLGLGLGVLAVTGLEILNRQIKLVHLFVYHYEPTGREPWPGAAPWNLDFSAPLLALTVALGACLAVALWPRLRRWSLGAFAAGAVAFCIFCSQVFVPAVAPHWGQRPLQAIYFRKRAIHGVDLVYTGLREVLSDWGEPRDLEVRSIIPDALAKGAPMKVSIDAPGGRHVLDGEVSRIDREDHRFWIAVPETERQKLAPLLERARQTREVPRRRFLYVNADRLIAWQLNWRGENFYTSGEIYNLHIEDARTVFVGLDNRQLLAYLKAPARRGKGRRFFLITEKNRFERLEDVLPTAKAKETLRLEDGNLSNKFALGSFILD